MSVLGTVGGREWCPHSYLSSRAAKSLSHVRSGPNTSKSQYRHFDEAQSGLLQYHICGHLCLGKEMMPQASASNTINDVGMEEEHQKWGVITN